MMSEASQCLHRGWLLCCSSLEATRECVRYPLDAFFQLLLDQADLLATQGSGDQGLPWFLIIASHYFKTLFFHYVLMMNEFLQG